MLPYYENPEHCRFYFPRRFTTPFVGTTFIPFDDFVGALIYVACITEINRRYVKSPREAEYNLDNFIGLFFESYLEAYSEDVDGDLSKLSVAERELQHDVNMIMAHVESVRTYMFDDCDGFEDLLFCRWEMAYVDSRGDIYFCFTSQELDDEGIYGDCDI